LFVTVQQRLYQLEQLQRHMAGPALVEAALQPELQLDRVWCGVVWCGVVWCGVVWCGVLPCQSLLATCLITRWSHQPQHWVLLLAGSPCCCPCGPRGVGCVRAVGQQYLLTQSQVCQKAEQCTNWFTHVTPLLTWAAPCATTTSDWQGNCCGLRQTQRPASHAWSDAIAAAAAAAGRCAACWAAAAALLGCGVCLCSYVGCVSGGRVLCMIGVVLAVLTWGCVANPVRDQLPINSSSSTAPMVCCCEVLKPAAHAVACVAGGHGPVHVQRLLAEYRHWLGGLTPSPMQGQH
jgi:hypothetical protein